MTGFDFHPFTHAIGNFAEGMAALVVAAAVLEATVRAVVELFRPNAGPQHEAAEQIRLRLGRWLALGLEILVAADILRTAAAPSWNEIGQLGAIIGLRTILNFFLQKEIDKAAHREEPNIDGRKAA